MTRHCPHCHAELGLSEDPAGCLTCRRVPLVSNPDRVIAILERADTPLAHWDVKRLLDQNGRRTKKGSLMVWLSTDLRACWGGPGIYGLYRHGLLPGVRDLGSAAAVFIHAADEPMTQDEARGILQHVGYRFQSTTIYLALRRVEDEGLLQRDVAGWWGPTRRSMGPVLGLHHREETDAVLHRAARQARRALAELNGTRL
jgi:hypothetical protein